jgi:hypothetical protein
MNEWGNRGVLEMCCFVEIGCDVRAFCFVSLLRILLVGSWLVFLADVVCYVTEKGSLRMRYGGSDTQW